MTRDELKSFQFEKTGVENLPSAFGGSVLILRYKEESTAGELLETEEAKLSSPFNVPLGLVLDIGPDAFKGESHFPSGPYFEIGQEINYLRNYCHGFSLRKKDSFELVEFGWIYCNNAVGGWPKGEKAPKIYPPSPERTL